MVLLVICHMQLITMTLIIFLFSHLGVFYRDLTKISQIEKCLVIKQTGDIDFRFPNLYESGNYCKVSGDHADWLGANEDSDLVSMWWWLKFSRTELYQYIKTYNMKFAHSMRVCVLGRMVVTI